MLIVDSATALNRTDSQGRSGLSAQLCTSGTNGSRIDRNRTFDAGQLPGQLDLDGVG